MLLRSRPRLPDAFDPLEEDKEDEEEEEDEDGKEEEEEVDPIELEVVYEGFGREFELEEELGGFDEIGFELEEPDPIFPFEEFPLRASALDFKAWPPHIFPEFGFKELAEF